MVWIFKIITHRLLSVLKVGGLFKKKKKGLAFPSTGWKVGLEICAERRIERVRGREETETGRLRRREPE